MTSSAEKSLKNFEVTNYSLPLVAVATMATARLVNTSIFSTLLNYVID